MVFNSQLKFNQKSKTRSLDSILLNIINGTDMYYSNDKWKFSIYYYPSNQDLEENRDYTVSVLYKDNPALAKCKALYLMLNCILEVSGQTKLDLIRINNNADNADIKWNNLRDIYDIPIICSLHYKNSFNLTHNKNLYNTYVVEIEKNELPENALVKMDVYYHEKNRVATCYHSKSLLDCHFTYERSNEDWIAKILPVKSLGTIQWLNMNSEVYIPGVVWISQTKQDISTYTYSLFDNLQLIDNKWNFRFGAQKYNNTLMSSNKMIGFFTANVRIYKENGDSYIYLTKCLGLRDTNVQCIVEGENQNIHDLVDLSVTSLYNATIRFEVLKTDLPIIRNATLTFKKVYDFFNTSSGINILVEDDEDLPEDATLTYDLGYRSIYSYLESSHYSYLTPCTYNNHILHCELYSYGSVYIYKLYSISTKGSITWTNLKEQYIDIPHNRTLTFKSAHDLFFTDKWNFLVNFTEIRKGNENYRLAFTVFIIDIIHNSKEVTAKCEIIKTFFANSDEVMHCISEYESQSENDEIKLRNSRKYGSITWEKEIKYTNISKAEEEGLINLDFDDAYDMYYSFEERKWIFEINCSSGIEQYGGIYKVDIYVTKSNGTNYNEIAKCLLLNRKYIEGIYIYSVNKLICIADYENQEETDLIKMNPNKSHFSTITWSQGLTTYHPIILKTSLFFVKFYDVQRSTVNQARWTFKLDVKDGVLPIGSKLVVDVSGHSIRANCTAESIILLTCETNFFSSTKPDSIILIKSPFSSVTWINSGGNEKLSAKLKSPGRLYFEETEKKWYFNLTTNINADNWKLKLDILYGDKASIASCIGIKNLLHCAVNEPNQNYTTSVKLSKTKTEGSNIELKNLKEDKNIPLWTELYFEKCGNIKLVNNNTWIFYIFLYNRVFPDNAYFIIDLYSYYKNPAFDYGLESDKTAECFYYNDGQLKCEYISDFDAWYDYIELNPDKLNESESTVIEWIFFRYEEYVSYFNLETNINYIYNTKIREDFRGYFYIYIGNNLTLYSQCSIDILINDKPDLIYCFIYRFNILKCFIERSKLNGNKIYISKEKSNLSSATWNNLNENQPVFSMQFEYIHSYYQYSTNNQNLDINILTSYEEGFSDNIIVSVKICIEKDKKTNKSNNQEIIKTIPCLFKHGIIFCSIPDINKITDEVFIIAEENSQSIIEWKNPGNYTYDHSDYYDIKYKNLLYCCYDNEKNYYIYALSIENNINKGQYFVMDLLINDINSYGLCKKNEIKNGIIDCHTRIMEQKDNHIIKIKNGRIYGNIEISGLSNDLIIYPNNIVVVAISKTFDLQFRSNKWEFKIKTSNNAKLNEVKILDILINNKPTTANCEDSNDIILCKVNDFSQEETQLIKLTDEKTSNENIYLANLYSYNIPLISQFELINSSDIEYNNGWSFNLKVKNKNNFNIPIGSVFSIDIIYNEDKEDLALCSEKERNNDELDLLCIPQSDIPKKELIILSTEEKSTYASVNFNPPITDENKYIFFNVDLEVEYVTMVEFNEGKWKFNIAVKEADIPLEARIRIDIKYNNINDTATCILKAKNIFECVPEILSQNIDDEFSLWPFKIKGTATLFPPEKLKFIYLFNFVKGYNLKFNYKWTFDILLSECKAINGISIFVDILIDDEDDKAICHYNDNILNCEVNNEEQNKFNIIKLSKEQKSNNDKVAWTNINKDIILYLSYEIIFIEAKGGFHDGKWKLNILYELPEENKKMYNNYALLDISVNNKQSTSICELTYSSFLKCISEHANQKNTDIIKIGLNKDPILGTITLDKIIPESQNQIKPANININYNSNIGYKNENGYLEIVIEGTNLYNMTYDLEEETVTYIELLIYNKYNNEIKYDIACLTNNIKKEEGSYIYMICPTEIQFDNNKVFINVDSNGYSNNVRFSTDDNIEVIFKR